MPQITFTPYAGGDALSSLLKLGGRAAKRIGAAYGNGEEDKPTVVAPQIDTTLETPTLGDPTFQTQGVDAGPFSVPGLSSPRLVDMIGNHFQAPWPGFRHPFAGGEEFSGWRGGRR